MRRHNHDHSDLHCIATAQTSLKTLTICLNNHDNKDNKQIIVLQLKKYGWRSHGSLELRKDPVLYLISLFAN